MIKGFKIIICLCIARAYLNYYSQMKKGTSRRTKFCLNKSKFDNDTFLFFRIICTRTNRISCNDSRHCLSLSLSRKRRGRRLRVWSVTGVTTPTRRWASLSTKYQKPGASTKLCQCPARLAAKGRSSLISSAPRLKLSSFLLSST